jgi:hypothetical protein
MELMSEAGSEVPAFLSGFASQSSFGGNRRRGGGGGGGGNKFGGRDYRADGRGLSLAYTHPRVFTPHLICVKPLYCH